MSQLSKFINLVIEYGQKLQSTLNKKYKPFIRSICNLQQLAKTVDPQNIVLTRQMIIFKLGLEAKSTKSIEISLLFLQKFFSLKFVDLNVPNYCQQFQIEDNTVRKKQNTNIKNDFKHELLKLLEPLIHFKNHDINQLLFRVYEYLITEPIAPILIELNTMTPCQIGQKILYNYFSYRFYIYEEIYTFTEAEFKSINALSIRNQRINQQIQAAFVNHQNLLDLVHKYVGQIVVAVAGIGGKYGLCVICKEPADYYCKITKASLCGSDCKKRHIELAQKQYKAYYQAVNLWKELEPSFQLLLQHLSKKQSRSLLNVFVSLLEKPHLFMIVRRPFRALIGRHASSIVNCALNYKDQSSFENIYSLVSVLCRYWMIESMSSIEYFFKESVLKIIEDKKPNFKLIIIAFKALAKIFQYGKTTIEFYVNFDCEYNKTNIIQRIMFELSRICQDKFASSLYYNKHEKIALKNSAVTILHILAKGLNQYRLLYPQSTYIEEVLQIKQRKTNLEKFLLKFNQHWSQGLKTLFNLNMVGLESQIQIIDIIMTTKGLKKQKIQEFLLSQNGREYIDVLFNKIAKTGPFMGLVQLFRIVPLKKSSILLKHYSDYVLKMNIESKETEIDEERLNVAKWAGFVNSNFKLADLNTWLQKQNINFEEPIQHVYMKCLETKNQFTMGGHKTFFRHCISSSYLEVFASQLSLLQIPILFLLQTEYSHQKIFQIITELIQICPHANWITLCLKNVDIQRIRSNKYTEEDHSLIGGCLKLIKVHAQFIYDWQSIFGFISKLYKIISLSEKEKRTNQEQHLKIREEITVLQIQQYLLSIGQNSIDNFNNFIISFIKLSQEQLQKENIFFLQKTFEILQHNLSKFIQNFSSISNQLQNLILKNNSNSLDSQKKLQKQQALHQSRPTHSKPIAYSSETLIYISDMLKQLFAKILKHVHSQQVHQVTIQAQLQLKIELKFFDLFSSLLQINNKQVNDFVMNSISMIIMHHYNLSEQTWEYILKLMKEHVKGYRHQTLTILQKIIAEKLKNCEKLQFDLINLALEIVDEKQTKISIQSIHLLKDFVELMIADCKNNPDKKQTMNQKISENKIDSLKENQQGQHQSILQEEASEEQMPKHTLKQIKQYLIFILQNLIEFISYDCHEGSIQILFILLKTKLIGDNEDLLLKDEQINLVINKIYKKLQNLPRQLVNRGEKIMNQSLFWSVRNKNYGIIKNLQACIINKYSSLSYTAMKCIKTFISMTNPKQPQDWNPIQQTLVKILKNTHLSDLYQNIKHHQTLEQLIQKDQFIPEQQETNISLTQISNKLIIQRMTVEVLPNDVKIIDELLQIYKETLDFNDDIYLRCLLWREGLGEKNKESPPDILSLEELISYRIISTYYYSKEYEKIADFTLNIIHRYCQASSKWEQLQEFSEKMTSQASNKTYELYITCKDYWQKRRQPLKVIINYMLPKLPKICKYYQQKEKIVSAIIEGMKFCEERTPYIQTIRQLTLVR